MSEYQYYEFLAIDNPLTEKEMAELRTISSRATISPVSFTNEYNWGDLRCSSEEILLRYFDIHIYVANWMTAILQVRLPIEALSTETAEAMTVPYVLTFSSSGSHWIITWALEDSENYDRFGMEDGTGWMGRLASVRDELLRGDIRSLYIGWLAAVSDEMIDDDELEPRAVSGLGNLTAAQKALAEYLEVDQDLLSGAGIGGLAMQKDEISEKEMEKWIDTLTQDEVKTVLKHLLTGKGQQTERNLKTRYAAWQRDLPNEKDEPPRRTLGELRQNAEKSQQIRVEEQEHKRKKLEIRRREERIRYLKILSKDFPKAWKSIREPIKRGSGKGYDEACSAIVDISEAHALLGTEEQFNHELKKFMAPHLKRKALVQRLVKAGIWEDKR
jgi:hypothetical protein